MARAAEAFLPLQARLHQPCCFPTPRPVHAPSNEDTTTREPLLSVRLGSAESPVARNGSSPRGGDCEVTGRRRNQAQTRKGVKASVGRYGLEDWDCVPTSIGSIGRATEPRPRARPRPRKGGVWSPEGQGLMGTGRRRSLVGGRGQGQEAEQGPRGAEYLHEPTCPTAGLRTRVPAGAAPRWFSTR